MIIEVKKWDQGIKKINFSEVFTAVSGHYRLTTKTRNLGPTRMRNLDHLYYIKYYFVHYSWLFIKLWPLKTSFLFKALKTTAVLITGFGNHCSKPLKWNISEKTQQNWYLQKKAYN